jgi:hypothetical protein
MPFPSDQKSGDSTTSLAWCVDSTTAKKLLFT